MESQLDRAKESQRQQIQQADMALERFKKQVEFSSEKTYADMKLQVWYTNTIHSYASCCWEDWLTYSNAFPSPSP